MARMEDSQSEQILGNEGNEKVEIESIWCTEDVVYHVFDFLSPCDMCQMERICKSWEKLIKSDNSLWKRHCCYVFPKILNMYKSGNNLELGKKYNNLLYKYYISHKKIRYDGVYIIHVIYYIESEASIHAIGQPKGHEIKPYQKIDYFRYLRFFAPKLKSKVFYKKEKEKEKEKLSERKAKRNQIAKNMNNLLTKHSHNEMDNDLNDDLNCIIKSNDDEVVYPVIYSYCKESPSNFYLFNHFNVGNKENEFLYKIYNNNKDHCLEYKQRANGIVKEEKIYLGQYSIDASHSSKYSVDIDTDYGVKLILGLTVDQTVQHRDDRLRMSQFDRYSIDRHTKQIICDKFNKKVSMPLRHEPFVFVPDSLFDSANDYFN